MCLRAVIILAWKMRINSSASWKGHTGFKLFTPLPRALHCALIHATSILNETFTAAVISAIGVIHVIGDQ